MNKDKNIPDDLLHDLLESLPVEKPATGFHDRTMERIRLEKTHPEKRSDSRLLALTITLAVVILGLGSYALYAYIDWGAFTLREIPKKEWLVNLQPENILSTGYSVQTKALLPFAGIFLFLLLGDFLLRRRFLERREQK